MSQTDAWLDIGYVGDINFVTYWICQKAMHGWIFHMSETGELIDIG